MSNFSQALSHKPDRKKGQQEAKESQEALPLNMSKWGLFPPPELELADIIPLVIMRFPQVTLIPS